MATEKSKTQSKPKLSVTAKIDRMIDRENATVKGMFARMPFRSYKGANGETKYSDIVFAITDSARHSIEDAVIGAYREALGESEDELPDKDESPTQSM